MRRMVTPQVYRARLEEKLDLNDKFIQFSFELIKPHRLEFQAGQYVSVKVNEQGERRCYSIISTPEIDHRFNLLVDISPDGIGSRFFKNIQFGAEIDILAPVGRFVIPDDLAVDDLVFVAIGAGIAPFKSMIEDQLRNKQDQRQITLYWGMRHPEDLFWLDELEDLDDSFANFHFHPTLSQAPTAWTLCRGRVTDCLSVHSLSANAAYFLCGNKQMVSDVTALLIGQGVNKELVFIEKFY
jgi:NAD(P)H-flavin reductase